MSRITTLTTEAGRILLPLAILAAGVGAFLVFGQKPKADVRDAPQDRGVLVETDQVQAFDGTILIDIDGVATPFRRVTLAAEVDGRIVEKSPKSRGGKVVEENAELLVIDPTDYSLEVARLQTQLRQANEELASVEVDISNTQELVELAQENLDLWQRELARQVKLARSTAVTEASLDDTRRQELSGRNSLQTQKNQLASLAKRKSMLEAARDNIAVQLQQAEAVLARTRVRAPMMGTVITSHVEEGDYVREGDPLVEISAARPMEVRCNLRIDQLYWVWLAGARQAEAATRLPDAPTPPPVGWEIPQLPVEVMYDFGGEQYIWDGILFRYDGTGLDEQTRTVPCRVLVEDPLQARLAKRTAQPTGSNGRPGGRNVELPNVRLFSGMYVDVRIRIEPPVPLLAIPNAALRPGNQVWVVRDGRLTIRPVEIAKVEDSIVLVRSADPNLVPGDRVVTSPLAAVQDGMDVTVSESASNGIGE